MKPCSASHADEGVALGAQELHLRLQHVGVLQRGERDRLGDRRQVVRQPHHPERVDHAAVGGDA